MEIAIDGNVSFEPCVRCSKKLWLVRSCVIFPIFRLFDGHFGSDFEFERPVEMHTSKWLIRFVFDVLFFHVGNCCCCLFFLHEWSIETVRSHTYTFTLVALNHTYHFWYWIVAYIFFSRFHCSCCWPIGFAFKHSSILFISLLLFHLLKIIISFCFALLCFAQSNKKKQQQQLYIPNVSWCGNSSNIKPIPEARASNNGNQADNDCRNRIIHSHANAQRSCN